MKNDLIPEAVRQDGQFVGRFLIYLDRLAAGFERNVDSPLDFLAFAVRNLLEFSSLLPVVFESESSKALFMNEAFRIDLRDLNTKVDAMFAAVGHPELTNSLSEMDLDWLPDSSTRLTGQRDVFDSWVHKFCSKLMHPTAVMIMAGEALADSPKRVTLCVAGLQYLGKSYNILSDILFPDEENPPAYNVH